MGTNTSAYMLVADGTSYNPVAISGDVTIANTGAITLDTVNGNVGSFGTNTAIPTFTVNAKGLITAASTVTLSTALPVTADSGTQTAATELLTDTLNHRRHNSRGVTGFRRTSRRWLRVQAPQTRGIRGCCNRASNTQDNFLSRKLSAMALYNIQGWMFAHFCTSIWKVCSSAGKVRFSTFFTYSLTAFLISSDKERYFLTNFGFSFSKSPSIS